MGSSALILTVFTVSVWIISIYEYHDTHVFFTITNMDNIVYLLYFAKCPDYLHQRLNIALTQTIYTRQIFSTSQFIKCIFVQLCFLLKKQLSSGKITIKH